jgi:hypothetical protein
MKYGSRCASVCVFLVLPPSIHYYSKSRKFEFCLIFYFGSILFFNCFFIYDLLFQFYEKSTRI